MRLQIKFRESDQRFKLRFGEIHTVTKVIGGQRYEGEYSVIPKVESQTIPTKNKVLTDDMKIESIPFFKVSNNSGGNTVYIGNEV